MDKAAKWVASLFVPDEILEEEVSISKKLAESYRAMKVKMREIKEIKEESKEMGETSAMNVRKGKQYYNRSVEAADHNEKASTDLEEKNKGKGN